MVCEFVYYMQFKIALLTMKSLAHSNYFVKPYFVVSWPVRVKANAKASLLASKRGDKKEALKYSRQ
jgi:hypothetical protein